jgi:hypothetical protein
MKGRRQNHSQRRRSFSILIIIGKHSSAKVRHLVT